MSDKSKEEIIAEALALQEQMDLEDKEIRDESESKINIAEAAIEEKILNEHLEKFKNQVADRKKQMIKRKSETEDIPIEELTDETAVDDSVQTEEDRKAAEQLKRKRIQMTGSLVSTDIDKLEDELLKTKQIMHNVKLINEDLCSVIDNIITQTTQIYNSVLHTHNYHLHSSLSIHTPEDGYITSGNGGPSFAVNSRVHKLLIQILTYEMNCSIDLDCNDKLYYHDFIFEQKDTAVPLALRLRQASNLHMPGRPRYYYSTDNGPVRNPNPIIPNDDYEVIYTGHRREFTNDMNEIYPVKFYPTMVDRDPSKTVEIWTWKQYLDSIEIEIENDHDIDSYTP